MSDIPYYGYPPPADGFWATIPLDYPIIYPDYSKPSEDEVHVVEDPPEALEWVPTNSADAAELADRAVKAGHEGWDGSPLWIIRSVVEDNIIPGKLAIKHNVAYVPHNGNELQVEDIEVLCVEPGTVRWLPATNGRLPLGAIIAGNTAEGEPLYAGRVNHAKSITPGKVHPSRGCCIISYSGTEIAYRVYEVLCKVIE